MLKAGSGRRERRQAAVLDVRHGVTGAIEPEKLSALMTSDRRKPRAGVYRWREAGGGSEPFSWHEPKEPGSSKGPHSRHRNRRVPKGYGLIRLWEGYS